MQMPIFLENSSLFKIIQQISLSIKSWNIYRSLSIAQTEWDKLFLFLNNGLAWFDNYSKLLTIFSSFCIEADNTSQ